MWTTPEEGTVIGGFQTLSEISLLSQLPHVTFPLDPLLLKGKEAAHADLIECADLIVRLANFRAELAREMVDNIVTGAGTPWTEDFLRQTVSIWSGSQTLINFVPEIGEIRTRLAPIFLATWSTLITCLLSVRVADCTRTTAACDQAALPSDLTDLATRFIALARSLPLRVSSANELLRPPVAQWLASTATWPSSRGLSSVTKAVESL